jgi:hypothetical protein
MSTVIQIKRSANVAAPTTLDLLEGELAYSYDKANNGANAKLYIEAVDSGNGEVIHTIGGKYYTDKVDAATNSATPNTLVQRDANGSFSANNITATTINGTIVGSLSGQASSAVIANTANALTTGRYINLSGDVSGSAYFDGTGNAEISATVIQTNSVALGTDTTGDYVANVLAGTGIEVTGQGGETATPTVALTNTGVTANTYGGVSQVTSFTVDAQGRITAAANLGIGSFLTADNTATLSNKTFDTANNTLRVNGNQISSYTGSGSTVVLDSMPTLNGFNIRNSDLTVDGGTGTFWAGQSGVVQSGDLKAGVYATDPSANNSLFTFGTNGSNFMSVGVEGSLFVGTALPSNSGGLNSSYAGWLVVQSGGKFGGDIDTLGGLNLTDATSGKITFSDGTIQRTAYTSNHLTTANVVELTNLYFTNARARAALTSGNTIAYDTATGNITLTPSGVVASTYGGQSSVPTFTVDEFGRITSAANVSVLTSITLGADSGTADTLSNNDTLRVLGGSGIDTSVTDNTITVSIETSGVTADTYGGASKIPVITIDSLGRITSAANVSVAGVSSFTATGNTFTISTADGGSFSASIQHDSVRLGTDTTGDFLSNVIAGTGITITNQGGEGATPTITNAGVVTLTGTANEIEVSASTGSVTIGLPDNVTINKDLSVSGNLYVTGNVVALPVENLVIEDSLIQLANNNISADIIDIGFYGSYNTGGGDHEHAGLFRDASDGKFKLFEGLQGQDNLTSTINITGTGYKVATLVADLLASNANVTTALTFGNENHKILPLSSSILEVRGGVGDAAGALSLAAGDYPTSYSKIYLESAKKITAQADEFYVTLFNDGNTKLVTMNTTHTIATSNTNGALRVAGGAGFTGDVYAASFHGYIDGGVY